MRQQLLDGLINSHTLQNIFASSDRFVCFLWNSVIPDESQQTFERSFVIDGLVFTRKGLSFVYMYFVTQSRYFTSLCCTVC